MPGFVPAITVMTFFRKEVFENLDRGMEGKQVDLFPVKAKTLSLTLLAFLILSLALSGFITYSQKVTVKGMLLPDGGIINVHPLTPGYVKTLYVKNRQQVKKGEPLFSISVNNTEAAVTYYQQARQNHLDNIDRLKQEIARQSKLNTAQNAHLLQTEQHFQAQLVELKQKQALQQQSIDMLAQGLARFEQADNQRYFSQLEILSRRGELVATKKELNNIQLQIIDTQSRLSDSQFRRSQLKAQLKSGQSAKQLQIHGEQKQLMALDMARTQTVLAPADGVISNLDVDVGNYVDSRRPVLRLLPPGATMVARLALPMTAIGKVKPGQSIRIRLDTYPHYRFGQMDAKVVTIEDSLMAADEFARELKLEGPFYLAEAQLPAEGLIYQAQSLPLRSGMLLEADIIENQRSVLAWFFQRLITTEG